MLSLNKGEYKELVLVNEPSLDWHIQQAEDSHLRIVLLNMPTDSEPQPPVVHQIEIHQQGVRCSTEIYALAHVTGANQVEVRTRVCHDIGEGKSKQIVKFVLEDEAKGAFVGELKIQPHAQQVSAEQTNRNLLLSNQALMRTQPQLEIYADDVKASHGASTGQLDESALFYMQQRGIDAPTGRHMLVVAFMRDIIEQITDEKRREQLLNALLNE